MSATEHKNKATDRVLPLRISAAFLLILVVISPGAGQNPAAQPASANVDSSDIIQFLTKTIGWYRRTETEQQIVTTAADVATYGDNHRNAAQVVRLSFEFARQQAEAKAKQSAQPQNLSAQTPQYESLVRLAQNADQQVQNTAAEIPAQQKKLETATGKHKAELESLIAETQSEVALLSARRDALRSMVEFVSGTNNNGLGAGGLRAQIEELAHTVPPAATKAPTGTEGDRSDTPQDTDKAPSIATKEPPAGLWGVVADLFALSRKHRVLKQEAAATDALAQSSKQLRTPLIAKLRTMIQSGDQLAKEADSADPAVLAQEKKQLDQLTLEFKQTAGSILPLSKQGILLDLYKRNLNSWDDSVNTEFKSELKNLLARLAVLAIVILAILGLGEVWRKTIYRYVHETRRRAQFLLLRKIVLWFVIALVIAFTFATELGSVVTFAGLITAGVAVALQNVIVSMVGYFFLIGRFGIRVGDRVQVSGVTGDVIDIGLVRFHLMELGSGGTDSQPTGRVVAFSNSIVFQPAAGLFKQIPGTNFGWHEINLTFAPESDYQAVRETSDRRS